MFLVNSSRDRVSLTVVFGFSQQAVVAGGGALFIDSGSSGANSSADIAMKIREDPLFLIKQKELEAKKKLASNPVKLKRLQQVRTARHVQ